MVWESEWEAANQGVLRIAAAFRARQSQGSSLPVSAPAARIQYSNLRGLNKRHLAPHSPGG